MTTSIDSKVSIRIDGKQYQAEAGWTVLRAAREAGFQIPTLCHNEKLAPFSSCFVCVVEVKGAKGFVPSCSTTVAEGMEISVSSEAVFAARKAALELLVSDHFGDCEPPCRSTCPARVPIRDFLALAAKGEYVKAAQKIRETLPFPGSLGRVCPKFCETACRRTRVDEPVSVCFMKRFVSDMEMEEGGPFVPKPGEATGKSVGIVGAGPAGLTAAYFLRLQGHAVTIYEKHECPGGMLKWGIPDYRLPPDVLSRECEAIIGMGVEVKYNTQVGPAGIPFEELRRRHDAMFIAVGAQKSSDMPIEGDTSKGILAGIDFLEQCARGERPQVGRKVAVMGGGDVAMDCARTSVRLGAEVIVLYRRTRKEMPASPFEIEEAGHEGVKFEYLVAPVKVRHEAGKVLLECVRMALGAPDASGRRRPVPQPGSEFTVECDTCIAAIGQQVDASLADKSGINLTKRNSFLVDARTMATNLPGVFSGGDCATGADVAVRAIDAGRKAACSIGQYLRGAAVTGEPVKFNSTTGKLADLPESLFVDREKFPAAKMPALPAKERAKHFGEVDTGFSEKDAVAEAARCLKCGCVEADDCKLRQYCTEYGVNQARYAGARRGHDNDLSHDEVVLESGKCINCGVCVRLLEQDGSYALGFVGRGLDARVKPPFGGPLADAPATANFAAVTEACPTAGIVQKKKYKQQGIDLPLAAKSGAKVGSAK